MSIIQRNLILWPVTEMDNFQMISCHTRPVASSEFTNTRLNQFVFSIYQICLQQICPSITTFGSDFHTFMAKAKSCLHTKIPSNIFEALQVYYVAKTQNRNNNSKLNIHTGFWTIIRHNRINKRGANSKILWQGPV